MAISSYELSLSGFRFPAALPPKRSNFRILADVRYVNGRGDFDTAHAVLPDLDRWWECDPGKSGDPDFVRGPDDAEASTLDMAAIDAWDRLVILVRGDGIHSVQFKVFDIDRPDFLDRVGGALGDVVRTVLGRGRAAATAETGVFAGSLGNAADDVESALLTRLAGGDRLLFRGSSQLSGPGEYVVSGRGEKGDYEIRCTLGVTD